ncbi:energy-coupled thiamine transporter ThiT [Mobilitalea sibirica]|uniref:Energy-coupled thiamine transporter ThiT n=1 Tax=Mobilitalea sibirica TaxID=1462919 RepID=A0A8J7HD25_9FIRM|nr:energy-coupled thiamine transporter ThiT [Mobilitalea sibirica]MBH1941572.1 energy-coupled thiamine transporter ThiT [Mobilitalea sibirica]
MFQKVFDFLIDTNVTEWGTDYTPTMAGNITLLIIIALLFIAMLVFSGGNRTKANAKQLAFSAVAMTLAVVTSIYTVYKFPFGGSITLFRMFFISLIGYLYGTRVGVMTGIAYGLLDFVLDPYAIHFIQPLLDYPIAFGFLGLSGVFAKSKYGIIKGYILAVFGRYLCHVLTGIIFFSEYAGDQNPIIYSLGYNASYIAPEAIITILILMIPAVRQGLTQVKRMAIQN